LEANEPHDAPAARSWAICAADTEYEARGEHMDLMSDGYVELQNAEVLVLAKQRLEERGLKPISKFRWPSMRDEFKIESGRRSKGLLLRYGPASFKALGIATDDSGPEGPKASWPPEISFALDALGTPTLDAIEDRRESTCTFRTIFVCARAGSGPIPR